jgi:hypothetical protein
MPFLGSAKRFVLCAIGDEAARSLEAAAAMLRRHGVAVDSQQVDEPDGDAGETLLAQSGAQGADLLVMGVCSHPVTRGCASWCLAVPPATSCTRPCCPCSSVAERRPVPARRLSCKAGRTVRCAAHHDVDVAALLEVRIEDRLCRPRTGPAWAPWRISGSPRIHVNMCYSNSLKFHTEMA